MRMDEVWFDSGTTLVVSCTVDGLKPLRGTGHETTYISNADENILVYQIGHLLLLWNETFLDRNAGTPDRIWLQSLDNSTPLPVLVSLRCKPELPPSLSLEYLDLSISTFRRTLHPIT